MRRLVALIGCVIALSCPTGASIACRDRGARIESYTDLPGDDPSCHQKVFPYRQGRSCPSGEFRNFTIRRLTDFGERPVWSPDGEKIAFVEKEFGEVYELELSRGEPRCITCDFEHHGFLRVHYMKDGDYLLLGPGRRNNDLLDRIYDTGFYWMPAERSQAPRWIGEKHFEGVAVSRESRKIAFAKTWIETPFMLPSRMYVAELTKDGRITQKRVVYRSMNVIEAQDFLPGDKGLMFARYTPSYEVYGVDLATGKATNYSKSKASEEPEGIFPDGGFTLMESDRHAGEAGDFDIDIYMLRLDGTGRDVRRLTRFNDVPGEKATNPAVSPEGCRVVFMKAVDAGYPTRLTGTGAGIYMLESYECKNVPNESPEPGDESL